MPRVPVDAQSAAVITVLAVGIDMVTIVVPPASTAEPLSTVARWTVVVAFIKCCEWLAKVPRG